MKAIIRKELLAKRQALCEQEKSQAALGLVGNLNAILDKLALMPDRALLAGYAAHKGEIDMLPAMEVLSDKGYTLALPCMINSSKELLFRKYQPGDELTVGAYGINEPASEAPMVVPSVICVPLVAADKTKHRLGYGGGYYDATISKLKTNNSELITIGIAYDFQLLDTVPNEAHDERLDYICTPSRYI